MKISSGNACGIPAGLSLRIHCGSCGTEWTVGSTRPELRVDVCSNCHPFFTGEQRIVDTEGQVDRFMKRLQQRDQIRQSAEDRVAARTPANLPLNELEAVGKRYLQLLSESVLLAALDACKFRRGQRSAAAELHAHRIEPRRAVKIARQRNVRVTGAGGMPSCGTPARRNAASSSSSAVSATRCRIDGPSAVP